MTTLTPTPSSVLEKLLAYCRDNDWAGHDPYDALNSKLFDRLPFLDSRIPRLVLTQLLKRSPLNLRRPLLIPATHNPKAIALFLSTFVRLGRMRLLADRGAIDDMAQRLALLRAPGDRASWGYSFPWQTRTMLVPRGAPNLVCTVFAGNALVDAYEAMGNEAYLTMAASAADYIAEDLYWVDANGRASLSYPTPDSRVPVHNANLLGAALLCRVFAHNGNTLLRDRALAVARHSSARQRSDGSWVYGEGSSQQWVDGFHTGYNLCALRSIGLTLDTAEFEGAVRGGEAFYRANLFLADGTPRYFHDRTYPIDIHSAAQGVITLIDLRDAHPGNLALAIRVYEWSVANMLAGEGYFYYRKYPLLTNRISYMRWSQAWMLLATTCLIEATGESPDGPR